MVSSFLASVHWLAAARALGIAFGITALIWAAVKLSTERGIT